MKKNILSAAMIVTLALGICSVAMAEDTKGSATRDSLKSYGAVEYQEGSDKVAINSDDLYMLADQIDLVKLGVASQLEAINTYFTTGEGISTNTGSGISITHTKPSEEHSLDPISVNFDTLFEGIAASQSIPSDVVPFGYSSDTKLYKKADGSLTTNEAEEGAAQISVTAAAAENLSAGTAAWVNGHLVLGTGADNKTYHDQGKENTTAIIRKLVSLFYNHSENEEMFALNDVTGNGYTTSASCGKNSSKSGTEITLKSDKVPLYDLSDEDHPKLLYKVKYQSQGTSSVGNSAAASVNGSINLCDENDNVIASVAQSRFGNGHNGSTIVTDEFVLTNYNTACDYIYISITARANAKGSDGSASTSKTYIPTITCVYYSDPE